MSVYVSLTSIASHIDILFRTLESLISQTRRPDAIFLHVSSEPYLFDTGFKEGSAERHTLLEWCRAHSLDVPIHVEWVPNTGPHRKWIPLLSERLNESCFIVSVDDDTVYDSMLIANMLEDYEREKCIISYRGFGSKFRYSIADMTFTQCDPLPASSKHITHFSTGKGGVLFRPEMFKSLAIRGNGWFFDAATYTRLCPFASDVWFNLCRMASGTELFVNNRRPFQVTDLTRASDSLWEQVNRHHDNMSKQLRNGVNFLGKNDELRGLVFNSICFWDDHYRSGKGSGKASSGDAALWKGKHIQSWIDTHAWNEVIDHGCGDGSMAQHIKAPVYVGLDSSARAIEVCRLLFAKDASRGFCPLNEFLADPQLAAYKAKCALSINVLPCLVDPLMYEQYLRQLFTFATTFVVIHARDEELTGEEEHTRHRRFTNDIRKWFPDWSLIEQISNPHEEGYALFLFRK